MALSITAAADNATSDAVLTLAATGSTQTVNLTRNEPGQSVPLRYGGIVLVPGQPATVVRDYEVPLGVPVTYTVDSPTQTATSEEVTVEGDGSTWLIHLGIPSLSMRVSVAGFPEQAYAARVSVLPIIGRSVPVSQSEPLGGADGPLTINTFGPAERDSLAALLRDGQPKLLQTPPEYGVGNRYFVPTGVKSTRRSPLGTDQTRLTTIDTIQVDAAASIYQAPAAAYTWDQLATDYATWNSVVTAFEDWRDVPMGQAGAGLLVGF